jgi:hypothetical protein
MITDVLPRIVISADEERELIRLARERVEVLGLYVLSASAMDAREKLISAYSPAINRAAKVQGMDWNDLEHDLIEAFLRSIDEYDFASNNRLSHEIKLRFVATVNRAQAQREAFTIPTRTRALFYQLFYKEGEGVWSKALAAVENHPFMSKDNFVAIAQALHGMVNIEGAESERTLWGSQPPMSSLEISSFVDWLKGGLNDRERLVIDLHYGFDDDLANELRERHGFSYDEDISIPQIAGVLGVIRSTAWRIHNSAITKMREKINVDGD